MKFMLSSGLCIVELLFMCGCASSRSSGRYGDGAVYKGIDGIKTFRKFFIRKFEVNEEYKALVSPGKVQSIIPELVRARERNGDIPIDVVIRVGKSEVSGDWSIVFACLYSIIPSWTTTEFSAVVEVYFKDDVRAFSRKECRFEQNFKLSICSPLGWVPYSAKEGFQENEMKMGLLQAVSPEVFSKTVSKCIAMQLKQYAEEKLAVPDVDFE